MPEIRYNEGTPQLRCHRCGDWSATPLFAILPPPPAAPTLVKPGNRPKLSTDVNLEGLCIGCLIRVVAQVIGHEPEPEASEEN